MRKPKRIPRRPMAFAALEADDMQMLEFRLSDQPDLAHAKDLKGITLLMAAVYAHKQEAVDLLLKTAAPLTVFEAAALDRTDRLAELLDAGEAGVEDWAPDGFNPLHLACFFGQGAAAELLLDKGARLGTVSKHPMGVKGAHCAAAGRHWGVVDTLIARGFDVNDTQAGGATLLHHAAQQGDRAACESLLAHGADRGMKSARGQTPAEVARALGHEEVAGLLES